MGTDLPVVNLGNNTAQGVAAGQSHTCVLMTSGEVACWGYNLRGQVRDRESILVLGGRFWRGTGIRLKEKSCRLSRHVYLHSHFDMQPI